VLAELQRALEIIYGLESPLPVEAYLVGADALAQLGARPCASEELVVVERGSELELGLYVAPQILARFPDLGVLSGPGFLDWLLPAFATAAEGVSHFVYLSLRAVRDRTVSLLELEVQAEVDKFATSLLHLWKEGERRRSTELRGRLFDAVGFRKDLDDDERARYALANRLARGYASSLESRFVVEGHLEGLLRELRLSYRLSSGDKFAHLARLVR
jgi:hypothetical protein